MLLSLFTFLQVSSFSSGGEDIVHSNNTIAQK